LRALLRADDLYYPQSGCNYGEDGGHSEAAIRMFEQLVETPVALKVAELHQLRGFMGKSDIGHILLLATGARFIRTPDREAELLEHSYCSFRMPSVLAIVATTLRGK
jgi:hypothetical protein